MLNATISNRIDVTPELIIFHIKPDGGVPHFLPGQYVALGLPGNAPRMPGAPPETEEVKPDKLIKRAYSVGSSPEESDYLEFYVAVVAEGALTSRLALLKTGDRLFTATKIIGSFTLDTIPSDHNLILMSTGTGIAPYMAMLRTKSTWTESRKITLVHGVRFPQDLAYRLELESLQVKNPNFTYLPIASRADDSYTGKKGRIQKLVEDGELSFDSKVDHVFLCGNPAMITDLEKYLGDRGFTEHTRKHPGNLHLEKYW